MAEEKKAVPRTSEPDPYADIAAPPEELSYSRDAQHSTYQRVEQQREGEVMPPPGQMVAQTLGKPTEATD